MKKIVEPDLRVLVKDIRKAALVKVLFNTKNKRRFVVPLFGFIIPIMLAVVEEAGSEAAFAYIFAPEFKEMMVAALHHIKAKRDRMDAAKEVGKLLKDLKIKVRKVKGD